MKTETQRKTILQYGEKMMEKDEEKARKGRKIEMRRGEEEEDEGRIVTNQLAEDEAEMSRQRGQKGVGQMERGEGE